MISVSERSLDFFLDKLLFAHWNLAAIMPCRFTTYAIMILHSSSVNYLFCKCDIKRFSVWIKNVFLRHIDFYKIVTFFFQAIIMLSFFTAAFLNYFFIQIYIWFSSNQNDFIKWSKMLIHCDVKETQTSDKKQENSPLCNL